MHETLCAVDPRASQATQSRQNKMVASRNDMKARKEYNRKAIEAARRTMINLQQADEEDDEEEDEQLSKVALPPGERLVSKVVQDGTDEFQIIGAHSKHG